MWPLMFAYVSILLVMLVLDGVWLGWLAKGFYRRTMRRAFVFEVRWWAAALFYLLHAAGILSFAVLVPASTVPSIWLRGFLFGLFTYGTYDLTNLATIRHWSVRLACIDMAWGCFVTMLAAFAAHIILR